MDNYRVQEPFEKDGLYDPRFEHENCGIGAVVNIGGRADVKVVNNALKIVETLEHRAGKDAEGKTGDGVGILLQISHDFFKNPLFSIHYMHIYQRQKTNFLAHLQEHTAHRAQIQ